MACAAGSDIEGNVMLAHAVEVGAGLEHRRPTVEHGHCRALGTTREPGTMNATADSNNGQLCLRNVPYPQSTNTEKDKKKDRKRKGRVKERVPTSLVRGCWYLLLGPALVSPQRSRSLSLSKFSDSPKGRD